MFANKIFALIVLFSSTSVFANNFNFDGVLTDSSDNPIEGASVQINVQLRSPGAEDCKLFEENHTLNMTGSEGRFSIKIGSGARVDANPWTLSNAFSNRVAFTGVASCVSGTVYNPALTDTRLLQIQVNDGGGWVTLSPRYTLAHAPTAMHAETVGGFDSQSILRVEDAGTLGSTSPLTSSQYSEILSLVAGTSALYSKPNQFNGSMLPAIGSGESVRWNGSAWESFTPLVSGGETDPTVQAFAKSSLPTCTVGEVLKSDGTAFTCVTDASGGGGWTAVDATDSVKGILSVPTAGGLQITSGAISLPDQPITPGEYSKVTVDQKGRITSVDNLNGDDIASGTIGGSTIINTSGNITTAGALTAASVSAEAATSRSFDVYDSDNSNYIRFQAPPTASLVTNYFLTLPTNPGGSGQVLTTDGSGVLSWTSPGGGGTLTGITGTANQIFVDTTNPANPVLSLADLSASPAGTYGSATQVPSITIDSKGRITTAGNTAIDLNPVGKPLAENRVWIGNTGGDAEARYFSVSDLRRVSDGAQQIPASCTASQTMTWSAITDVFSCTNISILGSQVSDLGTVLSTLVQKTGDTMTGTLNLPADGLAVGSDNLILQGGNVGIGTNSPVAKLDVWGQTLSDSFKANAPGSASTPTYGLKNGLSGGTGLFSPSTDVLAFSTASVERMQIDSDGNFGIGAPAGSARVLIKKGLYPETLDIQGDQAVDVRIRSYGDVGLNDIPRIIGSRSRGNLFSPAPVEAGDVLLEVNGSGRTMNGGSYPAGRIKFIADGNAGNAEVPGRIELNVTDTGGTPIVAMVVKSNGNVGVGTSAPAEKMHIMGILKVQGTTDCILGSGSGATNCTSDRRLKDNITPIEGALDKINQISGVEFDWNEKALSPGRHDIGVIAQEVKEVFPTTVVENQDGYFAVDYAALVSPLIEAVKELRGWLLDQGEEIAQLKSENQMLKNYLCEKDPNASFCER